MFDLSGRTAVVTGGSKGLGKAMARALAQAGANIVIVSRTGAELEAALPEILEGTSGTGVCVVADLTDRSSADRVVREAGRVDILISNAGFNEVQAVDEITDDAWDGVLGVHLHSGMALTRAVAPQMKERGWGRIVYTGSILGSTSLPGRAAYSSAKSALQGLARAAAIDLGAFGITVNTITPGAFVTEMGEKNFTDEQRQALSARTALGRWGRPEELAGAVLLLASDAGAYITGSTILVDGGWLAR
jgi:NAD(P)-dependent dehydrogenase (short-subunit alcohol dehydrogenase family)